MEQLIRFDHDAHLDMIKKSSDWERLRAEIVDKAIHMTDHVSFDFRRMLAYGGNSTAAGRLMWQLIKPFAPQVLIGPGFGAAPLIYTIATAALEDGVDLLILMVRDKRKEHNQKKWVEGNRTDAIGKRAVMVDDFMLAGSALPLVKKALSSDKVSLQLVALALFFDMWQPLGTRQISTSEVPVVRLFKRHDIGLSRDAYDAKPPAMRGAAPDFIGTDARWWRLSLNKVLSYPTKCAPRIHGNSVLIADEKSVMWRHDLMTGDISWCVPSVERPLKAIVQELQLVGDDLVYACYDGNLTRLNTTTGKIVWRWKLDSSIHATPCIDLESNRIFINTEQWNSGNPCGHLQCVDLDQGRVLWKYRHAWWPPGSASYCASSNVVIAPCNDATLQGFDATTGALLWSIKTEGLIRGRGLVRIVDGKSLYFAATERGRLLCIETHRGLVVWIQRYGKGLHHQFLEADEHTIYTLDGKWHFIAFCIRTGKIQWLNRLRSPGCWKPVRCGSYWVVLSKEGHVAVLDPLHQRKTWESNLPGLYHQPPAIGFDQDGKPILIAASTTAGLLAFDIHPYYLAPIQPEDQFAVSKRLQLESTYAPR
jgi:outer membrane protein assembly factor BamB/orotate phosphoribosyltransferase